MPWELVSIGVGDYEQEETFRRLPNAATDAARIETCFGESLPEGRRFHTRLMINPTADEATKVIESILETLDDESVFILYFAGHAIQERGGGRQWLLCRNALRCFARGEEGTGAISSTYFNNSIERRGRGKIFIIIDACRVDPTYHRGLNVGLMGMDQFGRVNRDPVNKPDAALEEELEYQADVFTLYSCQPGEKADDNGAFAKALKSAVLDRVKNVGEVRLDDAFVADVTRRLQECNPWQKPHSHTTSTDFVLLPEASKPNVPPPKVEDKKPDRPENSATPSQPSQQQKTASQLTTEANAALEAGRYEEAERLANEALEIDSSFGWAIWVRDETRRRREKLEAEARRRREKLEAEARRRREEQKAIDQLLNEGWISLNNGDVRTALAKAETVLSARPNDPTALELKSRAEKVLQSDAKFMWAESARSILARIKGLQSDAKIIWAESPSRKAGYRQTLKIGNAKYGFRWIPAGEFDMGSPTSEEGRNSDETLHYVKLTKGFWALETEVTQGLYKEIMGENPSRFKGENLPVEQVSWDDAMKFCAKLTKRLPQGLKARLPTEAQWEYMARAGTKTAYWYGDSADSGKMNNNNDKTTPVKSYAPNGWGLYDVSGNVWEWCLDYVGDYPTGAVIDPKGPNSASHRVFRGGSWRGKASYCRSAIRCGYPADFRYDYLGFRFLLVCD